MSRCQSVTDSTTLRDQPRARNSDPDTSHDAAAGCAHDEVVGQWLLANIPRWVMWRADWTDEELASRVQQALPKQWSEGRIRHGRLWLQRHGLIVLATGPDGKPLKRKTRLGGASRVWRLA